MHMERVEEKTGWLLILHGRLDAAHGRNLEDEMEDALRQGAHRVALDMGGVDFMSSAGLRILLRYHKALGALGGELVLRRTSEFVRDMLALVGMESLFSASEGQDGGDKGCPGPWGDGAPSYLLDPAGGFCLDLPGAGEERLLGPGVWGLGLGAFDDAPTSSGEILAAEGYALMHSPGGGAPDFMAAAGSFVPTVHFASGVILQGKPSHCFRFVEALPGVPLSLLARGALKALGGPGVALALVAETAGLVGARLGSSSPEGDDWRAVARRVGQEDFFAFPAVRDHLAYRPEKAYDRPLALVVGVATTNPVGPLGAQGRPLGEREELWGHFHGAVFPFRAIPQGRVELPGVLEKLFDAVAPVGLLHLLHDRRPISGAGESAFLSGALWAGPLREGKGRGA